MWGDRDESGGLAVGAERGRKGSLSGEELPEEGREGRSWGPGQGRPRVAGVGGRRACWEGLGSAARQPTPRAGGPPPAEWSPHCLKQKSELSALSPGGRGKTVAPSEGGVTRRPLTARDWAPDSPRPRGGPETDGAETVHPVLFRTGGPIGPAQPHAEAQLYPQSPV